MAAGAEGQRLGLGQGVLGVAAGVAVEGRKHGGHGRGPAGAGAGVSGRGDGDSGGGAGAGAASAAGENADGNAARRVGLGVALGQGGRLQGLHGAKTLAFRALSRGVRLERGGVALEVLGAAAEGGRCDGDVRVGGQRGAWRGCNAEHHSVNTIFCGLLGRACCSGSRDKLRGRATGAACWGTLVSRTAMLRGSTLRLISRI